MYKQVNNKIHAISSVLFLSIVFVGCGGGGGSSSLGTTTLSGLVPGTLIEAFCKDGSYYKVNSKNNGTSNHPFELELPKNLDCKLVMTTNENDPDITKRIVTPIQLSDGTTTSTYFNLEDNVDIGYVGLATTGQGIQPLVTIAVHENKLKVNKYTYDPMDSDNDGIPNVYEDDDHDGKYNKDDDDDDNDGIKDKDDNQQKDDIDGDGIKNEYDKDAYNGDKELEEESSHGNNPSSNNTGSITLPSIYSENAGRLLSSQCYQCHGTNGVSTNSWDSIAGENELDEMFGEDEIMDAQAHGYTSPEINLIGSWLKTLPKNKN